MNLRRIQVRADGPRLLLRLESGYATVPMIEEFEIDPATALVLAHQLEAAVHTLCPAGLTPPSATASEPQQPSNPS